ncbi:MAG: hypothetical protein H0W84_14995 [Bacteroidetes bacterium]|nr:hypothetical protein [Bacteroidota bacterium]
MKKILSILLLIAINTAVFAQYEYRYSDKGNTRYMVTGGVGTGVSYWYSKIENTELYNKYGSAIKKGSLKYKSKTAVTCYDLNVLMPVADIMLGLGVNFETNTMDKIEIRSPGPDVGSIIYDQKFRIEKIYGMVEIPLQAQIINNFILDIQARFGYYGYSGVDRENFFGQMSMPSTYFIGFGPVANYRIIPHTYVYILPSFEYKYFNNNANEYPVNITHKIFTFTATAGVRIDVSRR